MADGAAVSLEEVSCRTGPLRVGRPLRGLYTGLGRMSGGGPPVGRDRCFQINALTLNEFWLGEVMKEEQDECRGYGTAGVFEGCG
jgi:hypothetical protein